MTTTKIPETPLPQQYWNPSIQMRGFQMFHFFLTYPNTPDFVNLDITEDSVGKVAGRLSGSAGLGGADAYALSHWLLKFGTASRKLRVALAGLASWKANEFPHGLLIEHSHVRSTPCPRQQVLEFVPLE
jgi:hypothetical protein